MTDTNEADPPERAPAAQLEQQRATALAATQAWSKALSDTVLNGRAELHRRIMAHPTSKETLEFLRARRESLKGGPTK